MKRHSICTPRLFINRKNELIVFWGRKTDSASKFWSPGSTTDCPSLAAWVASSQPALVATSFSPTPGIGRGGMDRSGRMDGRVRRSRDCVGLPSDGKCNWDRKTVTISQGQPFGYSCLTEINDTHVGLLWETNAPGCSASSGACLQVFSTLPLSLFE